MSQARNGLLLRPCSKKNKVNSQEEESTNIKDYLQPQLGRLPGHAGEIASESVPCSHVEAMRDVRSQNTSRSRPAQSMRNFPRFARMREIELAPAARLGLAKAMRFSTLEAHTIANVGEVTKSDGNRPVGPRAVGSIVEVQSGTAVVLALTNEGILAALFRTTGNLAATITERDAAGEYSEFVRSFLLNEDTQSLTIASTDSESFFRGMRCRVVPLWCLTKGDRIVAKNSKFMFGGARLRYPSFVEFDRVSQSILAYRADMEMFQVWRMTDCQLAFHIDAANPDDSMAGSIIKDVKFAPGSLIIQHKRDKVKKIVSITLVASSTGEVLSHVEFATNSAVQRIEHCGTKLIIKPKEREINIVDLESLKVTVLLGTATVQPLNFVFLTNTQLYLTFSRGDVQLWDCGGHRLRKYDLCTELHPEDPFHLFLTRQHEMVVTCGRRLVVLNAISGKLMLSITTKDLIEQAAGRRRASILDKAIKPYSPQNRAHEENFGRANRNRQGTTDLGPIIACLTYDDDLNELLIGDAAGNVLVLGV